MDKVLPLFQRTSGWPSPWAAVALDALVLRTVLVPAVMYLCGRANWWLPRWLDRRLPHLAIEPPAEEERVPEPALV
jgi:RND superfamily putative drug exporter